MLSMNQDKQKEKMTHGVLKQQIRPEWPQNKQKDKKDLKCRSSF